MLLDLDELLVVDEHRDLADLLEIEQGRQEGGGLDPRIALGGEPGERRADQDAADAKAQHAHLALAGGLLDRIEGRQRPVQHVVLEILVGQLLARIDPGDHEHRQTLVDAPFDQAVPGLQVEHVELVDPGRHDQQRPAMDLLGAGRILDQLDQLVLEHDLAGRGAHVPADLERLRIRHGDLQTALATLQVVQQMLQALDQVAALRLPGLAQHGRIGQREIAGCGRADELAGIEVDLAPVARLEARSVVHQAPQPVGRQQVGLLDDVEHQPLGPGRVGKAPIAAGGGGSGFRLLAEQPVHGALPEAHLGLPELSLGFDQPARIGHQLLGQLGEGVADRYRVDDREAVLLLALPKRLDHALGLLGKGRQLIAADRPCFPLLCVGSLAHPPSPAVAFGTKTPTIAAPRCGEAT